MTEELGATRGGNSAAAPPPQHRPRFLCDTHLGKLGRRLQLLGFDTVLAQDIVGCLPIH